MSNINAKISKLTHRGGVHIKVEIPNTPLARQRIKAVSGRKFSRTHRCWYIPNTFQAIDELKEYFEVETVQPLNKKEVISDETTSNTKNREPKIKTAKKFQIRKQGDQTFKVFIGNKIILEKHNTEWICAFVPYDKKGWVEAVKSIPGRKWDVEEKYWLLPNVKNTYRFLKEHIDLKHIYFTFELKVSIPEEYEVPLKFKSESARKKASFYEKLNEAQQIAIKLLEEQLILKRLSYSTQKTYKHHLVGIFFFHKAVAPEKITVNQVQQYLLHQIKFKKIAESTQNQIISAIKAYWEKVLKRDREKIDIPRPKKPKKLPNVLAKVEVVKLINTVENLKHKLILLLIYSSGLRLGEVVNLLIRDINVHRRHIHIKGGKGKKDRYVTLAETVLPFLTDYKKQYRPTYWLFEGQHGGKYSSRSVQSIFRKALEKSKVNPYATVHTLRHSYATHCVEDGHNLKAVQDALGHSSPETTQIYLHLSSTTLRKFKSPLDGLNLDDKPSD